MNCSSLNTHRILKSCITNKTIEEKRVPLGPIRLAISQIRFRPLQFVPLLTELDPSFPVNAFASQNAVSWKFLRMVVLEVVRWSSAHYCDQVFVQTGAWYQREVRLTPY